MIDQCGGLA